MSEALGKVENLTIKYKTLTAVDDLSFSFYEEEILAVIGPNGSGKTSAMECLEGLRKPSSGKITVLGKDPFRNRSSMYREMGVQLQEAHYPPHIKVKELCALFSSFYENPADWKALSAQLGLSEKENRSVRKLSGGEKQRLSILLALLPRPKLLILDELTTGLDPEIRHGMWENLKRIRQAGTTILLVSHYMDEVEELADRLLFLLNGKCIFTGTQEAFRAYAKERIPAGQWNDSLSLEKIYLLLSPKTNVIRLEDL